MSIPAYDQLMQPIQCNMATHTRIYNRMGDTRELWYFSEVGYNSLLK